MGASGFVGRHAAYELDGAGWRLRCATRDVGKSQRAFLDRHWVECDVDDAASADRA